MCSIWVCCSLLVIEENGRFWSDAAKNLICSSSCFQLDDFVASLPDNALDSFTHALLKVQCRSWCALPFYPHILTRLLGHV